MAQKTVAPARVAESSSIRNYVIEGVQYSDTDKMPNGELCISLPVRVFRMDMSLVRQAFEESGIPDARVAAYCEQLYDLIETGEMAYDLAQRMRRIG